MTIHDIFLFSINKSNYGYTSSQHDILLNNITYKSQPIDKTSAIEQSDNPLKMDAYFDVKSGSELAEFILNPPSNQTVKVKIMRLKTGGELRTIFTGRLMSGVYDNGWVKVGLEPVYTEMHSNGLTESVTRQCRYSLGNRKCGVIITKKLLLYQHV